MPDRPVARSRDFDTSGEVIHRLAAATLLGDEESELTLTDGTYSYLVRGGENGHLYYGKAPGGDWISIANWCFYGLFVVVRYRRPLWLRPMYRSLFAQMNFVSVDFYDHGIQLIGRSGEVLKGRRLRLSPPSALEKVMIGRFHYAPEKVQELKLSLNM
jgi:hypothetical protein